MVVRVLVAFTVVTIQQLNMDLDDEPGRLFSVTDALASAGVNIHALSVVERDFANVDKQYTAVGPLRKTKYGQVRRPWASMTILSNPLPGAI